MKHITLLILPLLIAGFSFKNHETLTLREALTRGLVKIKVTGLGGYSGQCLEAEIRNISNKNTELVIDAGTVFTPGDPPCRIFSL